MFHQHKLYNFLLPLLNMYQLDNQCNFYYLLHYMYLLDKLNKPLLQFLNIYLLRMSNMKIALLILDIYLLDN